MKREAMRKQCVGRQIQQSNPWLVAVISGALALSACGGGGSSTSTDATTNNNNSTTTPCEGMSPASCGATVEAAFFAEHFKLDAELVISGGSSSFEYGFTRVASNNGVLEEITEMYDPGQQQYAVRSANGRALSGQGPWFTPQSALLQGATLEAVVAGTDGNEYPVTIVSSDTPPGNLSLRFANVVETDPSGKRYSEAGFALVSVTGIDGTYPDGSKAYAADLVLMEPVNVATGSFTESASYASLGEFKLAFASTLYCLDHATTMGTSYGVRFDRGDTQATLIEEDQSSSVCAEKASATPLLVDVSEQTIDGVNFLVLSGANLPTHISTSLSTIYTSDYSLLISVDGSVVETGVRLPTGTSLDYRPGDGVFMNRTGVNAMLASVGRPQVP